MTGGGRGGGKTTGLVLSLLIFICAGLLLYVAAGLFLPHYPITEANFQTYPAHGAFLKSVYFFLSLAVLFLVLPFHFVLVMREELRAGRHRPALALLSARRSSAVPAGAVYLRTWWLGLIFSVGVLLAQALTAHLFENLKPNAHTGMFMHLAQWRLLLYFLLGLECLVWYHRALNEIKRECLNAERTGNRPAWV